MPHTEQTGGPYAAEEEIDFFLKLQHKFFTFDPNTAPLGYAESGINGEGSTAAFDTLLESYGTKVTAPEDRKVFPRTWNDFIEQVRVQGFSQAPGSDPRSGAMWDGFFGEYLEILKVTQGDYAGVDTGELADQFVEAFDAFLANYKFFEDTNTDGTPGPLDGAAGPTSYFMERFREWMTVTALHQTELVGGSYANISAFEQVFKAFFPNGTDEEFIAMRNELIEEFREDEDFYLPSHALRRWYDKVQHEYLTTQLGASSIRGTEGPRLVIIWRLFNLVVDMIGVIQRVGSVLADRLGFLTRYQKAYTELMAEVPVFTKGDGTAFGGEDDDSAEARQELNPKNQTLTENLRSFRSILSDEAKSLQSNVNQINESVNQQANLATSILQQMSTILQAIYR
ncbi:MAG: hypothetical protein CMP47_15970 [Rickettsiales bacterium]|nr:hypothetical protein [Rickettsiales bacterium]